MFVCSAWSLPAIRVGFGFSGRVSLFIPLIVRHLITKKATGETASRSPGSDVGCADLAVVVKTVLGSHFRGLVNSPPILGPILVGIGICSLGCVRVGCALRSSREDQEDSSSTDHRHRPERGRFPQPFLAGWGTKPGHPSWVFLIAIPVPKMEKVSFGSPFEYQAKSRAPPSRHKLRICPKISL